IIQRDLSTIAQVHDQANVRNLLSAIASTSASLMNFDSLARDLALSANTVRSHTALLDTLFLTTRLEAWSTNLLGRVIKTPKAYVTDSGLLCHLIGADADRLVEDFQGGTFRIGWDAGNGAAGPVLEKLVTRLPGEHHTLYTEVDGGFPNHHPDPTVEANLADLKALVAYEELDFGIAFDGDGDRIGAVDGQGRVIWGDQLLAILAGPVLEASPGATIIADVKASQILFDRIAELGGTPLMWKTGHSLIKSKMKETGAPLAGEMSGHIFFKHRWYGFDDALYAAVRLIEAVAKSGKSLTQIMDAMPKSVATPEMRFAVEASRKFEVVEEVLARLSADGAKVDATDGARVSTADGWWLLRASNTQDVLVARAEAKDEAGLERLVAQIDAQLAKSGVERVEAAH
ncbi:MAG: DUF4143 domain-containing protein, partial [Sphingomonas sp.]|nr:DUF4143 domain-containing protein [Sphingomonas sp.]